jgi:hypothetical protein
MAAVDEARYLQLAESLGGFRSKLRVRADTLDVAVRQQILRLIVKEVLVGADTITLRHSIPTPQSGPGSNGSPPPPAGVTGSKPSPGYLCVREVISPLLANLYLHWFDALFHGPQSPARWADAKLVRYADDMVMLAREWTAE